MDRQEWSWHSPELGRTMRVCRWGHYGKPLILFSTAGGDYLECERFLMIRALSPLIDAGRVKVYSTDGIAGEAWMDQDAPPWHKSWLQGRFDAYVTNELVPHVRRDCGDNPLRLAAAGASIGAYNALNVATKHPDAFDLCVAMSGTYDFDRWMGGHWDENYYFNSPIQFLPRMGETEQLRRLREGFFVIASGRGRWEAPWESEHVAHLLGSKGIPHTLELWGDDVDHDWPTWRTMLPMFLDKVL